MKSIIVFGIAAVIGISSFGTHLVHARSGWNRTHVVQTRPNSRQVVQPRVVPKLNRNPNTSPRSVHPSFPIREISSREYRGDLVQNRPLYFTGVVPRGSQVKLRLEKAPKAEFRPSLSSAYNHVIFFSRAKYFVSNLQFLNMVQYLCDVSGRFDRFDFKVGENGLLYFKVRTPYEFSQSERLEWIRSIEEKFPGMLEHFSLEQVLPEFEKDPSLKFEGLKTTTFKLVLENIEAEGLDRVGFFLSALYTEDTQVVRINSSLRDLEVAIETSDPDQLFQRLNIDPTDPQVFKTLSYRYGSAASILGAVGTAFGLVFYIMGG